MVNVNCENTECVFCSQNRECLYMWDIWVGDNYYGGCSEFEDYHDEASGYRSEYWKSIQIKDQEGKFKRKKAFGKRLVINGREFFTEDNPNFDEDYTKVTDGETGVFCGSISLVKNNWDSLMKQVQELKKNKYNNVLDLPIAEEKDGE